MKSAAHALGMIRPRKKHQPSFPSTKKHRDKNRGTTKNRGHQTKEKGPKHTTPKTHDTHRVGAGRYSLSANHRTSHSTCSILCAALSHRGSRFAQRKYAAGTPHAANMAAKGYGASASKVGFYGVAGGGETMGGGRGGGASWWCLSHVLEHVLCYVPLFVCECKEVPLHLGGTCLAAA